MPGGQIVSGGTCATPPPRVRDRLATQSNKTASVADPRARWDQRPPTRARRTPHLAPRAHLRATRTGQPRSIGAYTRVGAQRRPLAHPARMAARASRTGERDFFFFFFALSREAPRPMTSTSATLPLGPRRAERRVAHHLPGRRRAARANNPAGCAARSSERQRSRVARDAAPVRMSSDGPQHRLGVAARCWPASTIRVRRGRARPAGQVGRRRRAAARVPPALQRRGAADRV